MSFIKYTNGVTNHIVEYMECACMSPEHLIKFYVDVEDGDVCLDVHLANWIPWYKRIWRAVKYVFGYKSKYGDFDSVILKDEDVLKIIELLNYQRKIKECSSNASPLN